MLAEDNAVNQKIATRVLEKQGHLVTVASDGREALALLDRACFDVVLMDVQMPEMDGFEATGFIRAGERGTSRHMPIIAMTAHAMQGDRDRCIASGMDDYIAKPLDVRGLLEVLEKFANTTHEDTRPVRNDRLCGRSADRFPNDSRPGRDQWPHQRQRPSNIFFDLGRWFSMMDNAKAIRII